MDIPPLPIIKITKAMEDALLVESKRENMKKLCEIMSKIK